jgi:hypothetical protein
MAQCDYLFVVTEAVRAADTQVTAGESRILLRKFDSILRSDITAIASDMARKCMDMLHMHEADLKTIQSASNLHY